MTVDEVEEHFDNKIYAYQFSKNNSMKCKFGRKIPENVSKIKFAYANYNFICYFYDGEPFFDILHVLSTYLIL